MKTKHSKNLLFSAGSSLVISMLLVEVKNKQRYDQNILIVYTSIMPIDFNKRIYQTKKCYSLNEIMYRGTEL